MTALFYILQSAVQVLGIFYLSFSLFRFKLNSYLGETAFFSLLIGGIIYVFRSFLQLGVITPMVICFLMIMFMWLVIKIPVFYSALMIVMGYVGIYVVESLLIAFGQSLHLLSLERIRSPGTLDSTVLIVVTNSILYFLGWWLYRKGLGFSFSFKPIKLKAETAGFLCAILFCVIANGAVYYSIIHFQLAIIIASVISIASLSTLIYLSLRKEYKEHD